MAQHSTSENASETTVPVHMGFSQVAEHFLKNEWIIGTNTSTEVSFNHPNDPKLAYDEFRLSVGTDRVNVLIPMPNSKVAYCTYFKDFFSASEYMIQRFDDYLQATSYEPLPNEVEFEDD